MAALSVRALGPVEITLGGAPLTIPGRKARSVLAVLALNHDRPVARGEVIDAVWGEDRPARVDHSLEQHVSALRKLLEPQRSGSGAPALLVTQAPGYLLVVDDLDVDDFERDATRGLEALAAGRLEEALDLCDAALRPWRGPALADLRDSEWFAAVATRLDERRATVVEARAEALVGLGRPADAVAALDDHVRAHPYRERARALQMLALHRSGRTADALACYQDTRRVLAQDLGLEPGTALRDLEAAILRQDASVSGPVEAPGRPSGLAETYRPDARVDGGVLRLPDGQLVALAEGTTLIGRVPEAQVHLSDSRVSRRHAEVRTVAGRSTLSDLGSTNGTTVNGRPADATVLAPGDVVSVGGVELLVGDVT